MRTAFSLLLQVLLVFIVVDVTVTAFAWRGGSRSNLSASRLSRDQSSGSRLKVSLSNANDVPGDRGILSGKKIDLLYDSDCPVCMMEVNFLKKRDLKGKIKFTDLRDPSYCAEDHGNVSFESGMRKLRAVLPDGSVVKGVEVFRETYSAIGLGWIFALTKLPVIGEIADIVYDVFAENRLRLTGQKELADILKERAAEIKELPPIDLDGDCNDGCDLDWDDIP